MEKSEVSYLHHSNNIETRELLMTWCAVLAVFFMTLFYRSRINFLSLINFIVYGMLVVFYRFLNVFIQENVFKNN